jgi:NADH dehydrogenase
MSTRRIIICGGGFAGLAAAQALAGTSDLETVVVDPREAAHFRPLLPDLIGRGIHPGALSYPLREAARRWRFTHVRDRATAVDPDGRGVTTAESRIDADGVVLATGSVTNFHGREELRESTLPLNDLDDGRRILETLERREPDACVIAGAGYTGIEIATQLWLRARKRKRSVRIVIAEMSDRVCPGMPEEYQDYTRRNVESLGIGIRFGTKAEPDGGGVRLSDGELLPGALLFWTAGMRGADVVRTLGRETTTNGRLRVDGALRAGERLFAAGDAAAFEHGGAPFRMAVQFSLDSGRHAAESLRRVLRGKTPESFRVRDLGYVIPMANAKSIGSVLGLTLRGRAPTALHYLMSIARSWGLHNRWEVLKDVLTAR